MWILSQFHQPTPAVLVFAWLLAIASIALALIFRGKTGKEIKGFDALRAIAVTLVILSHTGLSKMAADSLPFFAGVFTNFTGNFGVRIFFVLSGFLITSLLVREHDRTGRISILGFMMRRALRILPLYFLILYIAWKLTNNSIAEYKPVAMQYSFFYIYNFLPNIDGLNYLNHLWSLAVEEQFYIFWPIVFALLFARTRIAMNVFAVAIIVICFARMQIGYAAAEAAAYTPSLWTIPAIQPIMVGALIALNIRTMAKVICSREFLHLPILSLMLFGVCPSVAIVDTICTFGIGGLIGWIYLNQHHPFVQKMDWGIIGYFGTISYGLYMWQGFLTGNGPYRSVLYWPPSLWLGVALTFPAAVISFHLFERPIRGYGIIAIRRLSRSLAKNTA